MLKRMLMLCLLATAALAVVRCGSSSPPTISPTPAPTVAPTPDPTPVPLVCSPTPPPLVGIKVSVHVNQGFRKTLDSKPLVQNVENYCQRVGLDGRFCFTRAESDPQRADCDRMAVGIAADTGRYGPQWYYEGLECAGGGDQAGCNNHPDNQFLVIAKGSGVFEACAAPDVPIAQDRCGRCVVSESSGSCR